MQVIAAGCGLSEISVRLPFSCHKDAWHLIELPTSGPDLQWKKVLLGLACIYSFFLGKSLATNNDRRGL